MAAGGDGAAGDEGEDVIAGGVVGLVEGDDQGAGVLPGPLHVPVEVIAAPGVAGGDGAVVHVVAQVRDDEGDGGQRRVVGGEGGEGLAGRGGQGGGGGPGGVVAGGQGAGAALGPRGV